MANIAAARNRLQRAGDLPAVLDAACDAFEDVLAVLCNHQDPADDTFITFVMAATCAANGRDAVLFAPSLPAHRLHATPETEQDPHRGSAGDAVFCAGRVESSAGGPAGPGRSVGPRSR